MMTVRIMTVLPRFPRCCRGLDIPTVVKLGGHPRGSCDAGHKRPHFFAAILEPKKKRPDQAAWSLEVQFRNSWPAPGAGAGQKTVRCWGERWPSGYRWQGEQPP